MRNRTSQLVCTYCGYVFVVVFCVGFVGFAGFVPPPDPGAGAEQARVLTERIAALEARLGDHPGARPDTRLDA